MTDQRLDRRQILKGAGVLGAVGALAALHSPTVARAAETDEGGLSAGDVKGIVARAVAAANGTASVVRSNTDPAVGPIVKRPAKEVIAVVARSGRLLALHAMPDAFVGSQDLAIGKARTAALFSSNESALTSRILGELSQAHQPNGTGGAGPVWGVWASNQVGITGGPQFRNGLVTFPGGVPLYKDARLVGGIGASGDGVDQDEFIAFAGAVGFAPGPSVVKVGFTVPKVPSFP